MDTIEVIKQWVEKDSEVLDLGCGDGEILKILSNDSGATVLGVEINEEDINACIKSGLNVIEQDIDQGLENFGGCAVIISHDRWFLDRICTHILAFEGNSSVYYYEGGFSDYEENRKKRLGDISPTRIKYKKLKR